MRRRSAHLGGAVLPEDRQAQPCSWSGTLTTATRAAAHGSRLRRVAPPSCCRALPTAPCPPPARPPAARACTYRDRFCVSAADPERQM